MRWMWRHDRCDKEERDKILMQGEKVRFYSLLVKFSRSWRIVVKSVVVMTENDPKSYQRMRCLEGKANCCHTDDGKSRCQAKGCARASTIGSSVRGCWGDVARGVYGGSVCSSGVSSGVSAGARTGR